MPLTSYFGCPVREKASVDLLEQLQDRARDAIKASGEEIDDAVFDRLADRLSYLHGDVTDANLYKQLAKTIPSDSHPLYYLEMPPALFAPIVENLAKAELLERARVAVEKPFGHDLDLRATSTSGCARCSTKTRSCGWTTSWASSP